jgi:2'-5' RNA ligase
MKYFAGIVPPQDIYSRLLQIQTQFGDNRVEPHITLRPPVKPLEEASWLQTITNTVAEYKPIIVTLPGTGYFGKRVLFVSVQADPLTALYRTLIPALKPFEHKEDHPDINHFHPHLTLGRHWCGFTPQDFKSMQQLADAYLKAEIVTFEATHVRIYQKPEHGGRWQTFRDVALAG